MKHNKILKTLGPQQAYLVAELNERKKTVFTNQDVEEITGLSPKSARGLTIRLVDKGIATRLQPGLFILVPAELGHGREYMGDPHIIAAEICGNPEYFISHASAMGIHQMVTQPQLVVYTTTTHAIRFRFILGTEFRFVRCKPEHLFGIMDYWATKDRKIRVSDIERTIIDGLRQLQYCGGFSEVAKGFWMRRQDIDVKKLVEYALKLDIGAVYRRMGYLLELFGNTASDQIELLRKRLTSTYALLDPTLPAEGKFMARWRLRLNVNREEIETIIGA